LTIVSLLLVSSAGCPAKAPPETLTQVSGTVTLDGQPMADGNIAFEVPGKGPVQLPVTNGAFSGQVIPGENRVQVRSYKAGTPVQMGDKTFGGEKVNFIPAKYNTETTLKETIPAEGKSGLKYEVTSE
jgi:hypothetical protein